MRTLKILLFIALLGSITGCRGGCFRRLCNPAPPPPPSTGYIPPTDIPVGPPPASNDPYRDLPPVPGGSGSQKKGAELILPESMPNSSSKFEDTFPEAPIPKIESKSELPKEPEYIPPTNIPKEVPEVQPMDMGQKDVPATAGKLTDTVVGIERFQQVGPNVYTGQRAELNGLDWLQQNQFGTVVYLMRAEDDPSSDQLQMEKRNLPFVAEIVTPETLTAQWFAQFSATIKHPKQQNVFVFDRAGDIVPTVWYIYYRQTDHLSHEEASVLAKKFGTFDPESKLAKAARKIADS
ncbi:MAG: hypothetical protein R3B84_01765 [Zavarzinella sp.]